MGNVLKKITQLTVLGMLVFSTIFTESFAQTAPPAPTDGPKTMYTTGPRRQVATIVFAGLAGAVLGLSTLSFYGRPQDYLSNIAIGFAVGIISGTVYVTYRAASVPQAYYGEEKTTFNAPTRDDFFAKENAQAKSGAPMLGWNYSF